MVDRSVLKILKLGTSGSQLLTHTDHKELVPSKHRKKSVLMTSSRGVASQPTKDQSSGEAFLGLPVLLLVNGRVGVC